MAEAKVNFTVKGEDNETTFFLVENSGSYYLISYIGSDTEKLRVELSKDDSSIFVFKNEDDCSRFVETEEVIEERLTGLSEEWLSIQSLGFSSELNTLTKSESEPGYGPDDIFVENKPFSLKQIVDLIDSEDIDIAPDFQRAFVWDRTRQSRLIESILLGLPLPSIYLSQYDDGLLTVVDGLQRLHTINSFVKNKLKLTNLEYLTDCNDKTYEELSKVLSPLRLRKFGQTQIMCFVLDYRSPKKLKYDLFRRLNTGGKPLNDQEIRNCLSKPHVQKTLLRMIQSQSYKLATGVKKVNDKRMEAREVALRFIYFYSIFQYDNPVGKYDGNMRVSLDSVVEQLNKQKDLELYIDAFETGLDTAYHLFGDYCFRKVVGPDYINQKKSPVNKALMVAITVLLSKYSSSERQKILSVDNMTNHLANMIEHNNDLFDALTWNTNSKANMHIVYKSIKNLFDQYI